MKCIKLLGGPAHGRYVLIPSDIHADYRCALMNKVASVSNDTRIEPENLTEVRYCRREIMGSEVWVPEKLRDAQIIELLVEHYVRG